MASNLASIMRSNTVGAPLYGLEVIDESPDNSLSNSLSASGKPEDPASNS